MNAAPMVAQCLRRQQPELFGGEEVPEAAIPAALRYGQGDSPASAHPPMTEELMGNGATEPTEGYVVG